MKILTVIGARPQFVKAAVFSRQLSLICGSQEVLVHTGQHYDNLMSEIFFSELNLKKPDYNLGIGGGSHGHNTGKMIEAIESVLLIEKPDYVLVYGDTDSTLAATLAAVKIHLPVCHIESGLRSFNKLMPEEINRVIVDHCSQLLFVPTENAVGNLSNEGIKHNVHVVGDIMYDAALYYGEIATSQSDVLNTLEISSKDYILATIHRQENTDSQKRLKLIIETLNSAPMPVILPVHPRTRNCMEMFNIKVGKNLKIIDPIGYIDMIMLEKHAALIATDSGGVQKEAYFHKVPCVIFREETEWLELLDIQAGILVDFQSPQYSIEKMLEKNSDSFPMNIYGDGKTANKICEVLVNYHS